jgi:uncharacterized protein with NRDE domain
MCLIALAWNIHPKFPLLLAANRDELHERPADPLQVWPQQPDLIGGRDSRAGGSWLLLSRRRRMAAVTNVRAGAVPPPATRSRGALVHDFVAGNAPAQEFCERLVDTAADYGRFNLLLWDGGALWLAGNYPAFRARPLSAGLHAVSNGDFDADWPKTGRLRRAVDSWVGTHPQASNDVESLFTALADRAPVQDAELPDTGVGLERERLLAPPFVLHPVYGTRCSSVLLAGDQSLLLIERRFASDGREQGRSRVEITS